MEDKPVVAHKTPLFGDEESNLLDRFERLWFESHLHRAMQTRSFSLSSEPESAPLHQPQQQQGKRRRHPGLGFHRVLKKLMINPILSINSKSNNESKRQVQGLKGHPLTLKVFSRSLHF